MAGVFHQPVKGGGAAGGGLIGSFAGAALSGGDPISGVIGAAVGALGGLLAGAFASSEVKLTLLQLAQKELMSVLDQIGRGIADLVQGDITGHLQNKKEILGLINGEYKLATKGIRRNLWPSFNTILLEQTYREGIVSCAASESLQAPVIKILKEAACLKSYWQVGLLAISHPPLREKYSIPVDDMRRCSESLAKVEHERRELAYDVLLPNAEKIKSAFSGFAPTPVFSRYLEKPVAHGNEHLIIPITILATIG